MKKELGLIAVGALVAVVLTGAGVASAGDIETDGKLVSTVTSGAPLEVTSTEMVDNLNADQLDGLEGSDLYTQAEVDALVFDLQAQIDGLPGGGLTVVDDIGTVVGPVLGFVQYTSFDVYPVTAFSVGATKAVLYVRSDRLGLSTALHCHSNYSCDGDRLIYFEDPGCGGAAAIPQAKSKIEALVGTPDSVFAVGPGNVLYQSLGGSSEFTPQSVWNGSSCSGTAEMPDLFPVAPLVDLDDLFTPPYHLE